METLSLDTEQLFLFSLLTIGQRQSYYLVQRWTSAGMVSGDSYSNRTRKGTTFRGMSFGKPRPSLILMGGILQMCSNVANNSNKLPGCIERSDGSDQKCCISGCEAMRKIQMQQVGWQLWLYQWSK